MENKKIINTIPEITKCVSFYWDCPYCDETNEIEMIGDGEFETPLVCSECDSKFRDYTKEDF